LGGGTEAVSGAGSAPLVASGRERILTVQISIERPTHPCRAFLSVGGFSAADRRREKGVMSDTEPAAAAKAATERKPRQLRGHKKGAVTCCVASSARPGVVASSGEVTLLYSTRVGLSPRERLGTPFRGFASHLGLCVSVL
jgi:hypothetical protein